MDYNYFNSNTNDRDSQSMLPVGKGPSIPGNLLKMQNLRLDPRTV